MPDSLAKAAQDKREADSLPPLYVSPSDKPYSPKEPPQDPKEDEALSQEPVPFGEPSEIVGVGFSPSPYFRMWMIQGFRGSGANNPCRSGPIYTSPIRQRRLPRMIHPCLHKHRRRQASRHRPHSSQQHRQQRRQQVASTFRISSTFSNLLRISHNNSSSSSSIHKLRHRISLNSKTQLISSPVQCINTLRSLPLIYRKS